MSQLFLIFCMPKKKIYIVLMSQNIIQIVKKQVIPNGEGRHYLVVKKLSVLLRGITSKHDDGYYCLNCLHSFATENNLVKKYVNVLMFSLETNMLGSQTFNV